MNKKSTELTISIEDENKLYATGLLRVLAEENKELPSGVIESTGLLHYMEMRRRKAEQFKNTTFVMPDGRRLNWEEYEYVREHR